MASPYNNFAITVDEKLISDLLEDIPNITRDMVEKAQKADPAYIFDIAMLYNLSGNFSKALPWFYISAAMGFTEAYLSIGKMFIYGQHVERDFETAEQWCSLAMIQGHIDASATIGFIHAEKGEDLMALECYQTSAHQGSSLGEYLLGDAYKYGKGVPKDDKTAFEWFLKSAHRDFFIAQYVVGVMLECGDGVETDVDKALMWFHKCNSVGFEIASSRIENLNQRGHFYQPEI